MRSTKEYLGGVFYHGTARQDLSFHPTAPAYFQQKRHVGIQHAVMDSEVQEVDRAILIEAALTCRNPAFLEEWLMQDLHMYEHRGLVAELLARGHDCVLAENNTDEVCVIDPRCIVVVAVEPQDSYVEHYRRLREEQERRRAEEEADNARPPQP